RALGIYSATGASGFSFGLVLGGLLTAASWRWVFFLPVPLTLAVLAVARRVVPRDTPTPYRGSYDVGGAATATGGLLLLVYTVTQAPDHGWLSARTRLLALVTVALLAGFVLIESKVRQPLLPLGILRNRHLATANLVGLSFFGAYTGFQFIATLYLQDLLQWSALKMAFAFLPAGLLVAVLSPRVAAVLERLGARTVVVAGMVAFLAGYLLFIRIGPHANYVTDVLPTMVLIGIGVAAAFTAVNIAGVSGVANTDQGLAGGLVYTSYQAGGGVVLAVVTAVVTSRTAAHTAAGARPSASALLAGYHPGLMVVAGIVAAGLLAALFGFTRRSAPAIVTEGGHTESAIAVDPYVDADPIAYPAGQAQPSG
ncbi:MAG: MFS transporter, partial [Frankia sp.]